MRTAWLALWGILLILPILSPILYAQQKDIPLDTLRAKMGYYATARPGSVLFAHFDKTTYNNGETAWFTAYLLNSNKITNSPSTLSAILVREADKAVILDLKFAMKDGIAYGNVNLPDSIAEGNYSFILYTDVLLNNKPADTFTQHITIRQIATSVLLLKPKQQLNFQSENVVLPKPVLNFFPEGGNLVNATPGYIGVYAKDVLTDRPIKIKALLYKNKHLVDTIKTDGYGMGRFKLTPNLKYNYEVKLLGYNTTCWLPKIVAQGPLLHLTNAVVNDSVRLYMRDIHNGRYHIVVHNYQQVFYAYHVMLTSVLKTNTLSLKGVPRGVAVITVLDSLNRPVAERLFFAHFIQPANIGITTDKETYAPRQKVTLKLKLNNADAAAATVSIACVQESRLQPDDVQDISSALYLRHIIPITPLATLFSDQTAAARNLLENMLLIKSRGRYAWPEMSHSLTATATTFMGIKGLAGNTYLDPFSALVDVNGRLDVVNYFNTQNKRVTDLLNAIVVKVTNEQTMINTFLAKNLTSGKQSNYIKQPVASVEQPVALLHQNTLLNTVNVRATKLYNYIANECGDYVCRFNVLNCNVHRYEKDNTIPQTNTRYTVDDSLLLIDNRRVTVRYTFRDDKGKRIFIVAYNGCASSSSDNSGINNNGITPSRQFYSADYKQIPATQPNYLSTIYWQHAYMLNPAKETELSFFTSDALGPFKIIVQGIIGKNVIYAEKTFTVTTP